MNAGQTDKKFHGRNAQSRLEAGDLFLPDSEEFGERCLGHSSPKPANAGSEFQRIPVVIYVILVYHSVIMLFWYNRQVQASWRDYLRTAIEGWKTG